jgi:hypothetical protein
VAGWFCVRTDGFAHGGGVVILGYLPGYRPSDLAGVFVRVQRGGIGNGAAEVRALVWRRYWDGRTYG